MISKFALLKNLLLASAALAIPSYWPGGPLTRRGENSQSRSLGRVESRAGDASNEVPSLNWGGTVLSETGNGGTFDYVTATLVVPTASGDNGIAMIFIGIDGASCQTAGLWAGINVTITNKVVSYGAWLQWVPAPIKSFPGITISGGDTIAVTIIATSSTRTDGLVILQNLANSQISAQELNSTQPLCQENVEWIVGDPLQNRDPVHLANFDSVNFTHAYASGPVETGYQPSKPLASTQAILDIVQHGKNLTSVDINGDGLSIQRL